MEASKTTLPCDTDAPVFEKPDRPI